MLPSENPINTYLYMYEALPKASDPPIRKELREAKPGWYNVHLSKQERKGLSYEQIQKLKKEKWEKSNED